MEWPEIDFVKCLVIEYTVYSETFRIERRCCAVRLLLICNKVLGASDDAFLKALDGRGDKDAV